MHSLVVEPAHPGNNPNLARYFTQRQWIVFVAIVLIGGFFRWYDLEARPIHHDESLHIMYGVYYHDRPETGYYRYDPMLHGPALYTFLPRVYDFLGISISSARAPMAVLGCAFMFLPLFFRKHFSSHTVIALTTAYALSPTMIYWSRFVRHDFLIFTGLILMLLGAAWAKPKHKSLLIILGLLLSKLQLHSPWGQNYGI